MEQPTEGVTMEKHSIWIGAIVAAFGVTWLVADVSWWTTGSGYFSSSPFLLAAMLAAVGWWVARLRSRGRSPSSWSGLRAFLQRLFGVAAVFLLLSAFCASFVDPKGPTYRAAMKSDLRNLVAAQEEYRADSGRYTSSIPTSYFAVSSGVLEPDIALTADGWTASVDHTHSPRTCVIFVGTTPLPPAVREGEPACTPLPVPRRSALRGLSIVGIGLVLAAYGIWPTKRSA